MDADDVTYRPYDGSSPCWPVHLLPLSWPDRIPHPIDSSPSPYWKNNVQADE